MNLEQWYAQCTKSKGIINCIALRWLCPITVCLPMYVYLFVFVRVCLCVACHLRRRSRSILHRHRPTIGEYSYSAHAVRLAFLFCIVCPFHCRRFAAALSLSFSALNIENWKQAPKWQKRPIRKKKKQHDDNLCESAHKGSKWERNREKNIIYTCLYVCTYVNMLVMHVSNVDSESFACKFEVYSALLE